MGPQSLTVMTGDEVTEESVRRSLRGIVNGTIAGLLKF